MLIEKFLFTTAAEHHLKNEAIRESWEKMREINQDWRIAIFSDSKQEQFLKKNLSSRAFEAYQAINPSYGAARADFFRYCACFLLGGVYIDVKSHISAPLSLMLKDEDQFLLSQWDNRPGQDHADTWGRHAEIGHVMGGEFIQWLIVARSRHPFLKAVIGSLIKGIEAEQLSSGNRLSGWKGVLKLTGPIAFTRAIVGEIRKTNVYRHNRHYRYFNFHEESCHYSIFEDNFVSNVARPQGWSSFKQGVLASLASQYKQGHYSRNTEPIVLE